MKHGRAAEFRIARQTIPFQFDKPPGVRIHLLACRGQPLDGQLLQALAKPIQSWRRARIFKRKNQVDSLLRSSGRSSASPKSANRNRFRVAYCRVAWEQEPLVSRDPSGLLQKRDRISRTTAPCNLRLWLFADK